MRLSPWFSWKLRGLSGLLIESTTSSVAFDVHLEDNRMVHQAVDSESSTWWLESLVPVCEGLIGGDQH